MSLLALLSAAVAAGPAYLPAGEVPLGPPDRWDYVVFDQGSGRVYVAHGDRVAVVDGRAGRLVGEVQGIAGGTHGTAIAANGQGFTDDGRDGQAVAFDPATLKVVATIPIEKDADAIAADKATGRVFVVEGDPKLVAVIDPRTEKAIGQIQAGESLEYAVGDDKGMIYVAGAEKNDLVKIDARTMSLVARWPTPDCASPHGLAYDSATRRLFMGCENGKLMVVSADTGKVVAELPIGRGNDAVAFDPKRKRVFASAGLDGVVDVFQQRSDDDYDALPPVKTALGGRTLSVDPRTGRLFVAAADSDPPAAPGARPKPRPGTLKLLMFDPAP